MAETPREDRRIEYASPANIPRPWFSMQWGGWAFLLAGVIFGLVVMYGDKVRAYLLR